jgi:hypothetical protein
MECRNPRILNEAGLMTDQDMEKKIEQLKADLREREALSERELEQELRRSFREAGLPIRREGHYILEGEQVVPVDCARWSAWMEHHFHERMVARTVVQEEIEVSTVFLGLDHNWSGEGPPILFETMVFGGLCDGDINRYATMEESHQGHWAMVNRVQRAEAGEAL